MVLVAQDIMETTFLSMDEETDGLTAARAMAEHRRGYAVVTRGPAATVAGIVTEWDFLEKVVARGLAPAEVRLKALASQVVHSCRPETPTDEVVATMANLGIRRMVVRADDRVVGIITAKNVLSTFRQYIDRLSREIAGYQSSHPPLG